MEDLHSAFTRAEADPKVRVIGLTGAGDKAFASGSDLNEVEHRNLKKRWNPLSRDLPSVWNAVKNHYCRHQWYLHGWRSRKWRWGVISGSAPPAPNLPPQKGKLGIIPGGGATQRLPRIVGKAWGMEMLLMGETIDAEQAFQIGLITRLVEPEQLMPTLEGMADHIAAFAPWCLNL